MANDSFGFGSKNVTPAVLDTTGQAPWKLSLAACFSSLLMIVNGFVLIVLLRSSVLKKCRFEFILWLSASDLVIGMAGIMYSLKTTYYVVTSHVFCVTWRFFLFGAIAQSLVQTFLVCIERYLALVNNTKFRNLTTAYKYRIILCTWMCVYAYFGMLTVLFLRVDKFERCVRPEFPDRKAYWISTSVICFALLISIIVLYLVLVFEFMKKRRIIIPQKTNRIGILHISEMLPSTFSSQTAGSNRNVQAHHNTASNTRSRTATLEQRRKKEQSMIVTVGLIILALLVLSGPCIVIKGLDGMSIATFPKTVHYVVVVLAGSNSLLNPLLYAFRIPAFRAEVYRMFCVRT